MGGRTPSPTPTFAPLGLAAAEAIATTQDLLFAMMRSRGVHILDNFPCFFTTAHTEADFQFITCAYKDSVLEMQQSGFLPGKPAAPVEVFDASRPPAPGARLGRDRDGTPAWFVPDPAESGKFRRYGG